MTSAEFVPCTQLRPFVQLIWSLDIEAPPEQEQAAPERIAPDGVVELVLHYGAPMAMRFAGEELCTQPRSFAVTLTRRFTEIAPRGATGFLAVRFRPWGACRFLSMPVGELADRLVPAEELWGPAVRELEERLDAAPTAERRVALVEEFLLRRLRPGRHGQAEGIVRAVWRRGGDLRVADLCSELGLSERSLERALHGAVGMAPRSFIRLSRFLNACSRIRSGATPTLTQLAHDCGYYDQSHCIADVRAFSGMTPGELAAASGFSFLEPA